MWLGRARWYPDCRTNVMINVKFNREKLEEHDSIVKTPSELNPVVQPRYVDLTSRCPVEWSENRHFCPTFDVIEHRVWTALVPKVAKVRTRFWCMLMSGLGPIWMRPSPVHTPSWMSGRVSNYCCRPEIDHLLYYIYALCLRSAESAHMSHWDIPCVYLTRPPTWPQQGVDHNYSHIFYIILPERVCIIIVQHSISSILDGIYAYAHNTIINYPMSCLRQHSHNQDL